MVCKGCGKELGDGEARMVAEWPFCAMCFEGLLKKPLSRESATPDAGKDVPEPSAGTLRCHLCERELEPGEGKKVGIWTFCPGCMQDLAPPSEVCEPAIQETSCSETDAEVIAGTEEDDPVIARVRINLTARVACRGCGRRILLGGSRMVDGEPFCPECYYALPVKGREPAAAQGEEHSGSAATREERMDEPEAGHPGNRCAGCNRLLKPGGFEEVRGFLLCRACLSTDPDLAVQIARTRHRRNLERLRDRLNQPGAPTEPDDETP